MDYARYFDADYYARCCGRPYQRDEAWLSFFDGIAALIVSEIQPASVLDVGCAWGFLVECLRRRGVEAYGLDISEYAIQNVHEDVKPYCWVGSAAQPFPRQYDLIVSIEVVEHMPSQEAEKAIENFCAFSGDVLFSSTPFDYREATHVNVQPPEVWSELFARQGFYRDLDFNASVVTPWAVRYRRNQDPFWRIVRDYERRFFLLWKETTDLRNLTVEMRDEAAGLREQIEQARQATLEHERSREELQAFYGSRGWRLLRWLYSLRTSLIPPGSKLDRWLFKKHEPRQ
jgi:hypothetical protein